MKKKQTEKEIDKITDYPMMYLKWLDHNTCDGMWVDIEDIAVGPLTVETVGFLVDEDEISYQLISSIYETGDNEVCRGFWYILKSDVKEAIVL